MEREKTQILIEKDTVYWIEENGQRISPIYCGICRSNGKDKMPMKEDTKGQFSCLHDKCGNFWNDSPVPENDIDI